MPQTITPAKFTASGMVRLTIDFSGLTPAATTLTITRNGADGSAYTVRGAAPLTLSAGLGVLDDFEIPLDVDCTWTGVDQAGRTATTGIVNLGSDEAFGTPTAWITDPARPGASVPVAMSGQPEWTYPAQSVRLDVIGNPRPRAVSATRGSKRGTITFVTLNPASIADVRNVFSTGQVLLLRAPAGYQWGNTYFDAGDVREAHGFTILRHSARRWSVDIAEVDRPVYASQGFSNSWATATATYGTWGTMSAQTWLTVMQGTDPNSAGANTFVNPVYGGTVL
jgi:hypothetical protein